MPRKKSRANGVPPAPCAADQERMGPAACWVQTAAPATAHTARLTSEASVSRLLLLSGCLTGELRSSHWYAACTW